MPNITLTPDQVRILYKAKFNPYVFLALRSDRTDTTTPAQTVNADTFETNWKIPNGELAEELVKMESANLLKYDITTAAIAWDKPRTTTMTRADIQQRLADKIAPLITFMYDALLVDRAEAIAAGTLTTTSVRQPINITTFADSWAITRADVIPAINQIASRKILSLDLENVALTWLV